MLLPQWHAVAASHISHQQVALTALHEPHCTAQAAAAAAGAPVCPHSSDGAAARRAAHTSKVPMLLEHEFYLRRLLKGIMLEM
jgi:hypothetical protein